MNPDMFYMVVGALLSAMGFGGLIVRRHMLRKIISINIMSAGLFLMLVGIARRSSLGEPDPVPHALVLTGIVISISVSAFALSLALRINRETGSTSLPESMPHE